MNTNKYQGKARYVGVCLSVMLAWVLMLPMNLRGETITATIGKFRYSLNTTDYTAKVLGLSDEQISDENLEIPSTVLYYVNYRVTAIEDNAFFGWLGQQSLSIPATVATIGSGAFQGCENLNSLRIEDSDKPLYINSDAFDGCPISTLYYGRAAYDGADKAQSASAFYGSAVLKDITIGERVECLPPLAFSDCPMISAVEIPANCRQIGERAFSGCSNLSQLDFGFYSVDSIGEGAFSECTQLSSISLPYSLEKIGRHAFSGCIRLTKIDFYVYSRVRVIGGFEGCTGLRSVNFPEDLESIDSYAFSRCSNLEEITFNSPYGIKIGAGAFSECVRLKHINNLLNSTRDRQRSNYFGDEAFMGCTGLEEIFIDCGFFGKKVFSGCTSLEKIRISVVPYQPDYDENYGQTEAYYGYISESAFDNCPIESLHLHFRTGVKKLKETPFRNISTIKNLTLSADYRGMVLKPKEFESCKNSLNSLRVGMYFDDEYEVGDHHGGLEICEPFVTDSLFMYSGVGYVDSNGNYSNEAFGIAQVNEHVESYAHIIPPNAFADSRLKTAYVNSYVYKDAFKNCNIRLLHLENTKYVIYDNAFAGTKIGNIVLHGGTAPLLDEYAFDSELYDNTHVYVAYGRGCGFYFEKNDWKRFKNIDFVLSGGCRGPLMEIPLYLNEPENLYQRADSLIGVDGLSFDYAVPEVGWVTTTFPYTVTALSEYMGISEDGFIHPKKIFNKGDGGIEFDLNGYCSKLDLNVCLPFSCKIYAPTQEIKISSDAGAKVLRLSDEGHMDVTFDEDANPDDVVIKNSDATVVTSAYGASDRKIALKVLSPGHARITAMSKRHPQVKDSVDVYVLDPKFEYFEEDEIYLRVGEKAKLNVKIPEWMPWECIKFREYEAYGSFSVDQDGVITAKRRSDSSAVPGVELWFKGEKLATCSVYVYETSDISDAELGDVEIKEVDGTIAVKNVPNNIPVKIYGVSGLPLYDALSNGEDILFSPEVPGFYIVCIADKSYKIIVR